ncbi:hypothetical protein D9M71_575100 [compost metagenome]
MKKAYQQETLAALVADQALRECRAVRVDGGWSLQGRLGASWRPIRSRREPVRVWRSLTALGTFCDKVGIRTLTVEF